MLSADKGIVNLVNKLVYQVVVSSFRSHQPMVDHVEEGTFSYCLCGPWGRNMGRHNQQRCMTA